MNCLENSKDRDFPLCCGTGALTGHFYFHGLRVSRGLMVRCLENSKNRVYPRPCKSVFVRVGPCARVSPVTPPIFIACG